MPELRILCVAFDPLKFYPHMKLFSIASVELELLHLDRKSVTGRKQCDVTYGQTDRRTDVRTYGQTDDGEVISKCHLSLQQVTQKLFTNWLQMTMFTQSFFFQKKVKVTYTVIVLHLNQ